MKFSRKYPSFLRLATLVATSVAMSLSAAAATPTEGAILQLEGRYFNHTYVTQVDQRGRLEIRDGQTHALIRAKQLQPATFARLEGFAYTLANAEIANTHSEIVCMMIAPSDASMLSVAQRDEKSGFTGELRAVLSPEGCWNPDHVYPANEYLRDYARQAKFALELLTFENARFDSK